MQLITYEASTNEFDFDVNYFVSLPAHVFLLCCHFSFLSLTVMFASPQRSRASTASSTKASETRKKFAHHQVEIFTKEKPLPFNVRNVQPKGFVACQSKVNESILKQTLF